MSPKCENIHEFEIPIEILQIPADLPESTTEVMHISVESQDNVPYFVEDKEMEIDSETEDKDDGTTTTPVTAAFTPTGYLVLNNEYFRPTEYCVKRLSSRILRVRACAPKCESELSPCLPICCALDKLLHHNGSMEKCFHVRGEGGALSQYRPTLYRDVDHKLGAQEEASVFPHFRKHMPRCEQDQILRSYPFRRSHNVPGAIVRILTSGRVMVFLPLERNWKEYRDFCLAGLITLSPDQEQVFHYSGNEEDQILYVCGDYAVHEVVAPHFYVPVYFLNSFLLFVTSVVYLLLWDKQNVHGWTVLSFVQSMFWMYIFLAWSHLMGLVLNVQPTTGTEVLPPFSCRVVGIMAHFFFLSTFSWLSVVNVDLWTTFKSMAPISGRSKGVKRFFCYALFGWGTPTIVISVGLLLSHVYPDPLSQVKLPGYGMVTCFLEHSSKGLYLYYLIGALMGVNLIFMSLTMHTIYTFKAGTRAVDAARSNNSQSVSAKLFFKIYVVMGVTWIFEVASWSQSVEETILYWIILDLLNILQSGGVFFIFVCKRKILGQLEAKYPTLKVVTSPLMRLVVTRRATRAVTTTSGHGSDRTQITAFSLRKFQTSSKKGP